MPGNRAVALLHRGVESAARITHLGDKFAVLVKAVRDRKEEAAGHLFRDHLAEILNLEARFGHPLDRLLKPDEVALVVVEDDPEFAHHLLGFGGRGRERDDRAEESSKRLLRRHALLGREGNRGKHLIEADARRLGRTENAPEVESNLAVSDVSELLRFLELVGDLLGLRGRESEGVECAGQDLRRFGHIVGGFAHRRELCRRPHDRRGRLAKTRRNRGEQRPPERTTGSSGIPPDIFHRALHGLTHGGRHVVRDECERRRERVLKVRRKLHPRAEPRCRRDSGDLVKHKAERRKDHGIKDCPDAGERRGDHGTDPG